MKKGRNTLLMALAGFALARVWFRQRDRQTSFDAPAQPVSPPVNAAALPDEAVLPRDAASRRVTARVPTAVQLRRLPADSHLAEVHFGRAGARRDRRRRAVARLGIVALIASLVGVPGVNLGLEFLGERLGAGEDRLTRAELRGVTTSESAEGLMRIRGNMFRSRPTPTPTPTEAPTPQAPEPVTEPVVAPAGSVSEILYAAAAEFGIDGGYLVSVASCESGMNPGAVNPAGYHGLFQFSESTWASYGYGSIYDATAQARTAARMLAAGMSGHWPNCA